MSKYLFKNKKIFILCLVITIFNAGLNIGVSFVYGYTINSAISGSLGVFIKSAIFASFYFLLLEVSFFTTRLIQSKFVKQSITMFKKDIVFRLVNNNLSDINKNKTSKYISLLTNDTNTLETDYFKNIISMCSDFSLFFFATISLFFINKFLAIFLILFSWLSILVPKIFEKKLSDSKNNISKSSESYTNVVKDIFMGIDSIKIFSSEKAFIKKYNIVNEKLENDKYNSNKLFVFADTVSQLSGSVLFMMVIIFNGLLVIKGTSTIGGLTATTQLINYVSYPLIAFIQNRNKIKSVNGIYDSVLSLLNKDIDTTSSRKKDLNNHSDTTIKFENVTYTYEANGKGVKNLNLTLASGKKYLVVGQSGHGKSTIINLLLKNLQGFDGNITIGDTSINDMTYDELYNEISIVYQRNHIFNDIGINNICMFKDYDEKVVEDIIKITELDNIDLKNKILDENGKNLSGGERQRIALARGLIKNSKILILDEALVALDNNMATKIESKILDIPNKTIISIAHKSNYDNFNKFDYIIHIKDGMVAEIIDAKLASDYVAINDLIKGDDNY